MPWTGKRRRFWAYSVSRVLASEERPACPAPSEFGRRSASPLEPCRAWACRKPHKPRPSVKFQLHNRCNMPPRINSYNHPFGRPSGRERFVFIGARAPQPDRVPGSVRSLGFEDPEGLLLEGQAIPPERGPLGDVS